MATYGTTDRLTGGTPTQNAGTYPERAVDNDEGTYCHITGGAPYWWKYDCGAGVTWAFSKLRAKNYLNYGINAFNVTGSNNDSSYDTLYSGNMANNADWQDFTWTNTTKYRYIKINITSSTDPSEANIYEFEAFEGIYPSGGILNWWISFSEAWKNHDKLWTPKLLLPKEEYSY